MHPADFLVLKKPITKESVNSHHTVTFNGIRSFSSDEYGFCIAHIWQFYVLTITLSEKCASSVHKTFKRQNEKVISTNSPTA